jgi:thiol-disulfide isomerase/thioredoxin
MGAAVRNKSHRVIAIRFVGGSANGSTAAASSYACRDGYGAQVIATWKQLMIKREHRCGEGFGVQNSNTMILGIGARDVVPSLQVRWPSGKTGTTKNVAAGTLLTIYENAAASQSGEHFERSNYHNIKRSNPLLSTRKPTKRFPLVNTSSSPRIRIYTTMATWCVACKAHLPQLQTLRDMFEADKVELIGVPIDDKDDADKLAAYETKFQPAYQLRKPLSQEEQKSLSVFSANVIKDGLPLPSTIITDAAGNVLHIMAGVPDVSQVRKLISASRMNKHLR